VENDREDGAERPGNGVSRGQNQLHFVPEDWHAAAMVIHPLVERLDDASNTTQMLVIASDVDAAAGLGSRLGPRILESPNLRLVSATHGRRTLRVLRRAPAHILIATPEILAELLQSASLKLDDVKFVVLAWVDNLDVKGTESLEAVMTDVPKDAVRIIVASGTEAGVEQLVERYARRARRMQGVTGDADPVSISYLAASDVARPMALRRVLDALDPASAFVVVSTSESQREVEAHLRSLGYGGDASDVRVGAAPDAGAQLVVLYDFPTSAEQLRATLAPAQSARVVALAAPRQISTLRRWAGGSVTPLVLPDAALRARTREDAVREEIRETLSAGGFSRELIALEPLLSEHDGIEVAAALLRMLELGRTRPHTATAGAADAPPMTRVFVNVGEMDGVRPGDLVGAITNEAGLSKAEIGRVEIRDRHSTVEVSTAVANTVVSKLTGVSIRGRRALVKIDEGRDRRDSERGGRRERGGSSDGAPRRDRGSRPSPPRPPRPPSRTR
jgi:ATP-dependent RNA helicase DeaD